MRRVIVFGALLPALWSCSTQPMRDLRSMLKPSRGYYALHLGVQQFEDGTYPEAAHNLQLALDMGLFEGERADAHKYLAFIHCASGREAACRDEFRRALASDPDFTLGPAERGHPVWGPVFASVKSGARKSDVGEPKVETAERKVEAAERGVPVLQAGVRLYEEGKYAESAKSLQMAVLDQSLAAKDRAKAHKYLAFIHCASSREQLCRDEFRKALAEDPALDLTPAEAGHPMWGPLFRAVKAGH
jgi:Tfp pilus assembly protein PilF